MSPQNGHYPQVENLCARFFFFFFLQIWLLVKGFNHSYRWIGFITHGEREKKLNSIEPNPWIWKKLQKVYEVPFPACTTLHISGRTTKYPLLSFILSLALEIVQLKHRGYPILRRMKTKLGCFWWFFFISHCHS